MAVQLPLAAPNTPATITHSNQAGYKVMAPMAGTAPKRLAELDNDSFFLDFLAGEGRAKDQAVLAKTVDVQVYLSGNVREFISGRVSNYLFHPVYGGAIMNALVLR